MNRIRVMDETLANKIAAGEVVEKCSSIVKELCENSIDAGATRIDVTLLEGGKKLIEVMDDGIGMNKEDAHLAFQRHATSKIYKDDDLFFIDTLGFRGEALPSIASVSRTEMNTSDGEVGTHIIIEGGRLICEESGPLKKGTKIKITNLFYNTPARLKYLKSEQSELASCVSFLERLALSHPKIAFSLNHDGHDIVRTSGSGDLLKTIHEIYGLSVSSKMIKVQNSNDDFDLFGYIGKPEILKSNRNHMIVIVNDRVIKNYEINKAINDAYYTYKPDIKFPIVILNIYTDPTLVDVNIHPTKQDIKIGKMDILYDLMASADTPESEKSLAAQEIIALQKRVENEAAAEAMIKAKGFSEVFVRIYDESVDVIVDREEISQQEAAQIQDIITRITGAEASDIRISLLKVASEGSSQEESAGN